MIPSLVLAVRFLTIVPVPGPEAAGPGALGRAAWWFPVIGLALGGALALADRALLLVCPPLLGAGLLLSMWKIATGGIHLDGLADCLDGLGGGDRARRLAIMKDGRIGSFGAVGLVLSLVLAVAALAEMPSGARGRVLLLAPVTGRLAPLLIGPCFGPAGGGTGASFLAGMSRLAGPVWLGAAIALGVWLLGSWGPAVIAGALLAVWLWSAFLARLFGGLTGDVLGSQVELGELVVLLAVAALAHRGLI
ncbi:MAG TPA: adenosylcobinamide-GDP ribazoletransferase [Candidatus Methylomirabilis sp.]|nr:adenosylcobinamide-GDP ribazoletransferase [Candidatus Methylomirabilis sp.]